ncbi:MAG: hypothetical protein ACTS10_11005 [Kiloniellales bacterium]
MTDETQAATDAAAETAAPEAGAETTTTTGADAKAADTRDELLGGDGNADDGKALLEADTPKEEAKDAGDGDRDEGDSDKPDEAKEEVPETYELTAPEGQELDAEAVEAFTPVAKELGLTNSQAQKLTDLHAKAMQRQGEVMLQRHGEMVAGWTKDSRSDPEIGGDKLDETLRLGKAAMQHAFDKPTQDLLKHFGLLNHPGFIRGMRDFGQIVTDDRFVESTGKGAPRTQEERARAFYSQSYSD